MNHWASENGVLMCEHTYIPLIREENEDLCSVPNKRSHELIINELEETIPEQHLFFSPYLSPPPKKSDILSGGIFLLQKDCMLLLMEYT